LRNVQYGGGGGSGYYGGNWEKKAGGVGQNNGNSRSWTYTDDSLVATRGGGLAQTAVTDGQNGYIRIYGRGGSTGNSTLFSDDKAYVVRNVTRDGTTTNGLFLDLREWSSQVEVLIRGTVRNSSSNNFLSIYLETEGDPKYQYDICGDSDQSHGGTGTTVFTINENSGIVETWVAGGALYLFRSGDQESGTSSIFQGGESQCGSGVASGGEFDITVHEQLSTIGTVNNTGTNADLRVSFAIKGER